MVPFYYDDLFGRIFSVANDRLESFLSDVSAFGVSICWDETPQSVLSRELPVLSIFV